MVKPVEIQQLEDVVIAEAAAWIARLQGSARTPAAEAAFKEWLMADPAHASAFTRATEVWEIIPGATAGVNQRAERRLFPLSLAAGVLLAAVLGVVMFYMWSAPTYSTTVGQQQTITLQDGTRVSLNTRSKLSVAYTAHERQLRLERGEALFEVARDAERPFVVEVDKESVRALGTRFVVRKERSTVAVTLIEGLVEVTPSLQPVKPVRLSPGERITLHAQTGAVLDHPKVEALTAWRRGEVMFDDVSLLEAATEINRYGGMQVVLAEPQLAQLRVSGVFETADPQEFAQAMAQLHRLHTRRNGSHIVLEENPTR